MQPYKIQKSLLKHCSNRLFCITIDSTLWGDYAPIKASYFVTLSVVFALFTT